MDRGDTGATTSPGDGTIADARAYLAENYPELPTDYSVKRFREKGAVLELISLLSL